ncbi:acetyltransferase [Bacteroidales bacterium OttesenSCG-928-L03]|nr:acetyltransferase [Bacteroidales bacterium OttesenSCG-928-L03]
MKDIAIYGAGGFGREIACLLKRINREQGNIWNFIGFFDDGISMGMSNEFGPILGNISCLNKWRSNLSIAMAIGNPKILSSIVEKINNNNIEFPNIIAPDILYFDADYVSIGKGNIIGFKSVISCNVTIGDFNNFNTNVFIGHDVIIGDFNLFNPSVRISGDVKIGHNNFFGVGSIVLQQKKIGNNVTVGASSVIMRKPKDNTTYVGNPAIAIEY